MPGNQVSAKKKGMKITFLSIYVFLTIPVWITFFLSDDKGTFYLSKVISQFALCAFLYTRVQEEESHFSFMGLTGLVSDFISEGFAVYNNEITSELFALIAAFFFALCAASNIFDRWGFKKTLQEKSYLIFLSLFVLCLQFLVHLEVETKTKFWTTSPCVYSLGFMVIFQVWRHQSTSSKSFSQGLLGTLIHVISMDIKFIFLRQWDISMIKAVGLGELFANYFMTMGIDEHMVWRRRYTAQQKKDSSVHYEVMKGTE